MSQGNLKEGRHLSAYLPPQVLASRVAPREAYNRMDSA